MPPRCTLFPYTTLFRSRVVGRSTPVRLAERPASALKRLLLPAPVGPSRRTRSGASSVAARTRRWPVTWSRSCVARSRAAAVVDRKSTRLNSSHVEISYAAEMYTLSLHDALPISRRRSEHAGPAGRTPGERVEEAALAGPGRAQQEDEERGVERGGPDAQMARDMVAELRRPFAGRGGRRSEEHTSELQSRRDLVCRRDVHSFPTRRSSDLASSVGARRSGWPNARRAR